VLDRRGGGHDLVLTTQSVTLLGERVGGIPSSFDQAGLTLWRVEGAPRVATWVTGVRPNGDLLGVATVRVYDCGPGQLELTLIGKQGSPLYLRRNGRPLSTRVIPPGRVAHLALPAPPGATGDSFCVYELISDGLLGSTRIEYVHD
jgi:hypothetical protein